MYEANRVEAALVDRSYVEIGGAIRTRREAIGMTQDALANQVNLSRTSITNIERGRQSILVHHFLAICQALGVSATKLLPKKSLSAGSFPQTEELSEELRSLVLMLKSGMQK